MIEQYLKVAIEFIKEIWFQLNAMFGLEEIQAVKVLKTYLLQVQNNRTYLVIAIALLILIPFSIYKVISNSQKREKKFNELMDEMEDEEDQEEEIDINDPRRLRSSDPDIGEKEELSISPDIQILEKMDEVETEDELHLDTQKIMGSDNVEFELEPTDSELAKPEINENLNGFEEFEFDTESDPAEHDDVIDKNIANYEEYPEKDKTTENKPATEADDLINRLKDFQENLDTRLKEGVNEDPPVKSIEDNIERSPDFIEQENFIPETTKVSPLDKKKYMEVLESFIFLKDQNKH